MSETTITEPWPWPDDRLDRRSRVAHMYRARLEEHAPDACAELDAAMRSFGQTWIVDGFALDPETLLTTAEVAELADVGETAVRMWVYRGRLARAATSDTGRPLYRWGDVLEAQRQMSGRKLSAVAGRSA